MITQTSEIAIHSLMLLAAEDSEEPIPPARIAQVLGCSHSYLRKVLGMLSKAGLLKSHRGPQGGVLLALPPKQITMLAVVEACQGLLIGTYCKAIGDATGPVCAYHQAMWDIRRATRDAMARWTLADMIAAPLPTGPLSGNDQCKMNFMREFDLTK